MWNRRHGAMLFLNSVSTGFLAPVLTLLLLSKGCSLAVMPLAIGLHSAVTVVCEVPSGMAADRWGRRKCYLLSCLLTLPMLGLLVFGGGVGSVFAAMAFYGLAKAFSSGSLDALVVEEFLLKNGRGSLSACTGRISTLTSVGLAAGCLAGGGLYALTGRLWPVLALKACLTLTLLAMAAGLEEHAVCREDIHPAAQLAGILRGSGIVRALVLLSVAAAPPLFSVELFYQPRITELLHTQSAGWVLGALSAGAYYAAAAGSAFGRRATAAPTLPKLLAVTALSGACLLGMAAADSAALFVGTYLVFYAVIGWTDYLSTTLMNEAAPPQQRATLLSANSLALQLGGLAASPLLSAAVSMGSIPRVWLIAGLAVCALMLSCLAAGARRAGFPRSDGA